MLPHQTAPWARLEALATAGPPAILPLFAAEPDRLARLSLVVDGIRFDWSKLPVTAAQMEALLALADSAGVAAFRDRVAAGAIVNPSEGRAATHLALRDPARRETAPLLDLGARLHAGRLGDTPIRHLVHIGIGGSALGPQLLVDALGRDGTGPAVHIVANIDGEALHRALLAADPATTALIAVSKTFTTQETRQNLASAQAWLKTHGIADPAARTIAVTAAPDRARAAGIADILPFAESVGGRYSLWSAVGLPLAARAGPAAFTALLDGAHAMDRHWLTAPAAANAPILAALFDVWQAVFLKRPTRAVFAYDERLRLVPAYLQQLEMESNGKAVAHDGTPLPFPTAPVTWGGTGTDAQHAVFQLLHQGTHADPVEFLAVRQPGHGLDPAHHRLLLANCFAQGAALLAGRPSDAPHRAFPGNRPSSTILLNALDPGTLGALLAFQEARTVSAAALMGLNPFDQWGVELGKEVANRLASGDAQGFDPSTVALMAAAEAGPSQP